MHIVVGVSFLLGFGCQNSVIELLELANIVMCK